MKNIPKKIYLQVDPDCEKPDDFNKLVGITWSSDKINDTDLVYELVHSERTLGINSCAHLIKSMPLDQAIQIIKSDITGLPPTAIIEGELVVAYVKSI
jgi:hypothetical protein